MNNKKNIAILGSTGSIGRQALDVVDALPDFFEIDTLVANRNIKLLAEQARKYIPNQVVIADSSMYNELKLLLSDLPIKVFAGAEAINQVVEMDSTQMVLTAMVGYSGLKPTINAIKKGKFIALANKETLVVAGELIKKLALENNASIYPVDSEHSAIFQCLAGEYHNPIEKIYLTASGGPFRKFSTEQLAKVSKEDALKHPNWNMGSKITIDSASLMNKGLEAIEARWLFDLNPEQIDIIIHPQSIIHSIVQFEDGSMKAQMGLPDMKLPIQYALTYPRRVKTQFPRFNFMNYPELTFEKPDLNRFPNLALSFIAMNKSGNLPCTMNAANEIAVEAFLKDKISFLKMSDIIEKTMNSIQYIKDPTYENLVDTDNEARIFASNLCKL